MAATYADTVSYVILVRGMSEIAHAKFAKRFPQHRGGVNPSRRETYHTVQCDLSVVGERLDWIVTDLSAQYTDLVLGISIYAPRNWSNFDVPIEIIHATQKYGVSLRISFSSPVIPAIDPGGA
jgi:hypothetical protein